MEHKEVERIDDGIINADKYNLESKKLLIICKEPNRENHKDLSSFQKVWKDKPDYQFAHRVAELAYGILEGFKPYDTISNKHNIGKRYETLQRIAFMNVKKQPGTDVSNNVIIRKYIEEEQDSIIDQIKQVAPTHILAGLSETSLTKAIFKGQDISFKPTSYGLMSGEWNGTKMLHFYHPSARVGNAALYALLKVTYEELGW